MNKRICKKITSILYDKGAFIGDGFNDPGMKDMFNELSQNYEEYRDLFELFETDLIYDQLSGVFHLVDFNKTASLESKRATETKWMDIIDFISEVCNAPKKGDCFSFSDLFKQIDNRTSSVHALMKLDINIRSISKNDYQRKYQELIKYLKTNQVIEVVSKQPTTYRFTSVWTYRRERYNRIITYLEEK